MKEHHFNLPDKPPKYLNLTEWGEKDEGWDPQFIEWWWRHSIENWTKRFILKRIDNPDDFTDHLHDAYILFRKVLSKYPLEKKKIKIRQLYAQALLWLYADRATFKKRAESLFLESTDISLLLPSEFDYPVYDLETSFVDYKEYLEVVILAENDSSVSPELVAKLKKDRKRCLYPSKGGKRTL